MLSSPSLLKPLPSQEKSTIESLLQLPKIDVFSIKLLSSLLLLHPSSLLLLCIQSTLPPLLLLSTFDMSLLKSKKPTIIVVVLLLECVGNVACIAVPVTVSRRRGRRRCCRVLLRLCSSSTIHCYSWNRRSRCRCLSFLGCQRKLPSVVSYRCFKT